MRTGAAPRRQRTAPPRRAARTRVRTIGAGQRALRNREETKIYLVYLLLCFWYTIFSAARKGLAFIFRKVLQLYYFFNHHYYYY